MQLLNIKHQTRSALMRPGVSFQTKALRFCHKLPQFSVRTGASSGYKSVFDLIKDSPTLAAEEKLSMLGQLHSDEMRAAEARARAEAEKARAEVEKAAKLKNELYAARTDTARALGLLHMRGLIEFAEKQFRRIAELQGENDRKRLWRKALERDEFDGVFQCLQQHVKVGKNKPPQQADVIQKISDEIFSIYGRLSEDVHSDPKRGTKVSIDADILGDRKSKMLQCIADSFYLKSEIISWRSSLSEEEESGEEEE